MKILAITSNRADYDLMSKLYLKLNDDKAIELKLLVSGSHLSTRFGNTQEFIKNDKLDVLINIESLLDSDTHASRIKSASILLMNSIDIVNSYNPDLLIYAGDREDVFVGALLGGYLNIPTVHFFGGDHAADGHIDNPIRHATSKISTYHFVSAEEHKKRLLALGEPDFRVKVIGSVALDKFLEHKPIRMQEINSILGINTDFLKHAIIIFHPIDEESDVGHLYVRRIIDSLLKRGVFVFVGSPNSDPGNVAIIGTIKMYQGNENVHIYNSLSRDIFLSLFKHASVIAGNSSAGLLEAASIKVPVVNVGKRQVGRLCAKNVIFTDGGKPEIDLAIEKALSSDFSNFIKCIDNPYGDGKSVNRAIKLLKTLEFKNNFLKKEDPIG